MREEPVQSFPLPNECEFAYIFIKTELENAGIEVLQIGGPDDTAMTVTTNKEVQEEIKARIREFAADKGIAVTFEVGRE
jgi:hypothetical protein